MNKVFKLFPNSNSRGKPLKSEVLDIAQYGNVLLISGYFVLTGIN